MVQLLELAGQWLGQSAAAEAPLAELLVWRVPPQCAVARVLVQ